MSTDLESSIVAIYPWLNRVARSFCPDEFEAEDLVGDTVLKMLENSERFDNSKDLKPWAKAIMRNIFITAYNRKKVVEMRPLAPTEDFLSEISTTDLLNYSILKGVVSEIARTTCCIESVMLYADGYTYDEIANKLQLPTGTVRSRINKGRKLIGEAIGIKRK